MSDEEILGVVDLFLKDMDALERQQGIDSSRLEGKAVKTPQGQRSNTPVLARRVPTWLKTKRELAALRQQSEEMETQALFLTLQQEKRRRRLGITRDQRENLCQCKVLADRVKQQRRLVEEKNQALKRQLEACIQASSALQRTIATQGEEIATAIAPFRIATDVGVLHQLSISTFSTFKALEDRVDERFRDFHRVLEEIRQASIVLDDEHVQICSGDGAAGSVMEYTCTRLLPFDVKVTRNVAWGIVEEGGGPQKQASNVIRRSDNVQTIDSRFALPLGKDVVVAVDVHCVAKRFMVPEGCVLLAEASSEWSAFQGTARLWSRQSCESIWCVLRDVSIAAGAGGSVAGCQISAMARSEAVPTCCSSSSPESSTRCVGNDIVSSFSELVSSQRQCLENMLWDSVRGASSNLQTK